MYPPYFKCKTEINCNGKLVDLSTPQVMGIVNITPDSFYDGGRYINEKSIVDRVKQILAEGGTIVDVGAFSSRPGADDVSKIEEKGRLKVALEAIRNKYPEIVISVDTFRSTVAEFVVDEYKVDIINDISGGLMDEQMFATIAKLKVPYILMHMQGTPQTMQQNPTYKNVIKELSLFFAEQVNKLRLLGVSDIILDPGFGFGKKLDHNYQLLNKMEQLAMLELPILAGVSRKSMIYKLLENEPADALNGTSVLNSVALIKGARILRVHDVKEAVECVKLITKLQQS